MLQQDFFDIYQNLAERRIIPLQKGRKENIKHQIDVLIIKQDKT